MTERLTTLAAVKQWLGLDSTGADTVLSSTILAASQFVLNEANRETFAVKQYTEHFRGNGKSRMLLRNWPVLSIVSVGVQGASIPAAILGSAGLPSNGFILSDPRQSNQAVELFGYCFPVNAYCEIVYRAGYQWMSTFIPQADALTFTPTLLWLADGSVQITGVNATKVDANPSSGEYSVDENGVYTFSLADAGKTCSISYSYVPGDLAFAVTELIGETYRRKDRIGLLSKSLGGQETVTFDRGGMTPAIKDWLQPFKNVIPL